MTKQDTVKAIEELINKWNEYRAKWIEANGTDEGFAEWFTSQVIN